MEKYDVFISYQHDIADLIETVDMELKKKGIKFFRDKKSIKWGDNIIDKINEGLKTADIFLFFINEKFLKSGWTKQETSAALNLYLKNISKKRVLGILFDKAAEEYWLNEPLMEVIQAYKWDGKVSELEEMVTLIKDILDDVRV